MDIHHSLHSRLQCCGGKLFLGLLLPGVHLLPPCSCTPTIYRSFTHSLTAAWLRQAKLNRKKCEVKSMGLALDDIGWTWGRDCWNISTLLHSTAAGPALWDASRTLPSLPRASSLRIQVSSCIMLTTRQKWPNDEFIPFWLTCSSSSNNKQQPHKWTKRMLQNMMDVNHVHTMVLLSSGRESQDQFNTQHTRPIFTTFKPLRALTVWPIHSHTNTHIIVSKSYPSPGESTLLESGKINMLKRNHGDVKTIIFCYHGHM